MRYIIMSRDRVTKEIVSINEVLSEAEFNEIKTRYSEIDKDFSNVYYTDCQEIEEGTFESHLIDFAIEATKKHKLLKKKIQKILSEDWLWNYLLIKNIC